MEPAHGVTLVEGADTGLLPPGPVAPTVTRTATPFVRPLIVHVKAVVVQVLPPGVAVAV
jgi:hypothetical protein